MTLHLTCGWWGHPSCGLVRGYHHHHITSRLQTAIKKISGLHQKQEVKHRFCNLLNLCDIDKKLWIEKFIVVASYVSLYLQHLCGVSAYEGVENQTKIRLIGKF